MKADQRFLVISILLAGAFTPVFAQVPTPIPIPMEMVPIPAGSFMMGNTGTNRDEYYCGCSGCDCEEPCHEVTLDYIFQMGKYEVTNAQYVEVLNWAKGRGYLENSSGGAYSGGHVYHNGHFLLPIDVNFCDISYTGLSHFFSGSWGVHQPSVDPC